MLLLFWLRIPSTFYHRDTQLALLLDRYYDKSTISLGTSAGRGSLQQAEVIP